MRELYEELARFMISPGILSFSAWGDLHRIRESLDDGDRAWYMLVSVASRVARSRRERLPDALHNMMVVGVPVDPRASVKYESYRRSYMGMVSRLSAQNPD